MRAAAVVLVLAFAALAEPDPKVELGRRLFMDPTVSRTGRVSCSSCHLPEHGFSDPRALSEDEHGPSRRHSQPILDVEEGRPLHWDGEFASARDLLTARLGNLRQAFDVARASRARQFETAQAEGRNPDTQEFRRTISRLTPPYYGPVTEARAVPVPLAVRLDEDERYAPLFRVAFGSGRITTDRIIDAMHAYVLSLRSGENAYDRFASGNPRALAPAARRGLALFTGKADCASCHAIGEHARFTDDLFHNTGVAFRSATLEFGGRLGADGGAGEMTFVASDLGKFKTPSLRDVARRAPYMHDGSLATLSDVVDYYNKGGTPNGRLDEHVRPLSLTPEEQGDLVAFLEALTGDERPGLGPARRRTHHTRIRVVDLKGHAMRGITVLAHPAGDRLEGGRNEPPQVAVTDSEGAFRFEFPMWTHVRLETKGHELHYGWPIPDCVTSMTVMAAPERTVALKVRPPQAMRAPEHLIAYERGGSKKDIASFERVRVLSDRSAIYVAGARSVAGVVRVFDREFDVDLTGGWTDPLDLRLDE